MELLYLIPFFQDVINSLQAKLGLASTLNFALVVEHVKSVRRNKFTILDPTEHLCRIASRPGKNQICFIRINVKLEPGLFQKTILLLNVCQE